MKRKPRVKARARSRAKSKRAKSRSRSVGQTATTTARNADEALVAPGAQALGIPLDPSWHASVAFNFRLIMSHAAKVDDFALPDDAEPAPVFHA